MLGKHFHDSELYYDAFRYALAQANANQRNWELELDSDWYWLADHLCKDRGNLEAEFANQLSSIDVNLEQLEEFCMTLVIAMGRAPNHIEALAHSFLLQWMLAVLTENFRYGFHNSKTHCPMGVLLLRIYVLIPIEDPGDEIMHHIRDLIELIDGLGDLEMHVTSASTAWVAALVAAQSDLPTILDQLEMDWELTDCVETVREAQDTGTTVNDNEGWSDAETCAEIGDLVAAGLMSW
ncbi:hypothetical protein B0A48_17318 [Cryoendolithus antarcticus]|uniref:Uncharacterized protein n=1 Tax=Cryoendolithus antarcticus TaxID=1507870 RepID=A0A1V8SBV5_9PEZI|nr:hypothetical protein B0A48_17318 [Cryoendolithus antarcticus]